MAAESLVSFLVWCTLLNYAVLLIWFGALVTAHDWVFALHTRWFNLSREVFDGIHYGGMAVYKIGVLLFNLVPLAALSLV
ncbi:DUF6868 family protein [Algiphilus aromaticivorans]|uniref:DUF6868 family protein n=1 Tax=Algiphilus aromaticivorans TaxID=382454 RepID=UPI0005C22C62|nr:hypothetical protein [Algiphilus aromaticivorans]